MKISEVLQAFHGMPACDRMDLFCRMLRHCVPYEMHFLGTVLVDSSKEHYKSYVSKAELSANRVNYYSGFKDQGLTHEVCEKLCCALAVVHADNHPVAEAVFSLLNDKRVLNYFSDSNDLRVMQDYRLLYVLAVNHPAFTFNQRQHLMYTYLHRMDSHFIDKCKYTFSGSFSNSMEKTLNSELEKYPPDGHFREPAPDAYITLLEVHSVYKRAVDKRYVYMILVEWSDGTQYTVRRTYGDFFSFHTKLLDLFPEEGGQKGKKHPRLIPFLPGKTYSKFLKNKELAEKRLPELHRYSRELTSLPERISRSQHVLDFFKPRQADLNEDYPPFHKITNLYDLIESGKARSRVFSEPLKGSPTHSPIPVRSSPLHRIMLPTSTETSSSSTRTSQTLPPASSSQDNNVETTPVIPRRPTYPLSHKLKKSDNSAFTPIGVSSLSEDDLASTATLTASRVSLPTSTPPNSSLISSSTSLATPTSSTPTYSTLDATTTSLLNMSGSIVQAPSLVNTHIHSTATSTSSNTTNGNVHQTSSHLANHICSSSTDAHREASLVLTANNTGNIAYLASTPTTTGLAPLSEVNTTLTRTHPGFQSGLIASTMGGFVSPSGDAYVSVSHHHPPPAAAADAPVIQYICTGSVGDNSPSTIHDMMQVPGIHSIMYNGSLVSNSPVSTRSVYPPTQTSPTAVVTSPILSSAITPSPPHSGTSTPRSGVPCSPQIVYNYTPTAAYSYMFDGSPYSSPNPSPRPRMSKSYGSYTSVKVEESLLRWLKSLRLHKYYSLFENVTFEEICNMTAEQLEEKGMTKGAAKKLSRKLEELKRNNFSGFRDMPFSGGMSRKPSTCSLPAALLTEQGITPSSSMDGFSLNGSTCSLDKLGQSGVGRTTPLNQHGLPMDYPTKKRYSKSECGTPITERLSVGNFDAAILRAIPSVSGADASISLEAQESPTKGVVSPSSLNVTQNSQRRNNSTLLANRNNIHQSNANSHHHQNNRTSMDGSVSSESVTGESVTSPGSSWADQEVPSDDLDAVNRPEWAQMPSNGELITHGSHSHNNQSDTTVNHHYQYHQQQYRPNQSQVTSNTASNKHNIVSSSSTTTGVSSSSSGDPQQIIPIHTHPGQASPFQQLSHRQPSSTSHSSSSYSKHVPVAKRNSHETNSTPTQVINSSSTSQPPLLSGGENRNSNFTVPPSTSGPGGTSNWVSPGRHLLFPGPIIRSSPTCSQQHQHTLQYAPHAAGNALNYQNTMVNGLMRTPPPQMRLGPPQAQSIVVGTPVIYPGVMSNHGQGSPPASCFNCGKRGHVGTTCPGKTLESNNPDSFHKKLEKIMDVKVSPKGKHSNKKTHS